MSQYVHYTMRVPAPYRDLAAALCAGIAPGESGAGMFRCELSATGEPEPTYHLDNGWIWPEFAALLGDAAATRAAAVAAVGEDNAPSLETIEALYAASIFVETPPGPPDALLAQWGLQYVRRELP